MAYLLALDQGTTSSRAIVFDTAGTVHAVAQEPIEQIYPVPGWVEHNPLEIWTTQLSCARFALRQAGLKASDIAAIGIANQRETTLLWDRETGAPLSNALVWQDRRTADWCAAQAEQAQLKIAVAGKTGLVLDPYFSASKIVWLLDNLPDARARAERGELAFGTVDSWLLWNLTGGLHATDVSNAARTLLFNIHTGQWATELAEAFGIPTSLLPEVRPSSGDFGVVHPRWLGAEVPIRGIAGDQQAALFGQGCTAAGQAKNTYGTGCFMLLHCGGNAVSSSHGLLTTRTAEAGASFALEGSIFSAGATIQWLRDELKMIGSSAEVEGLAASVPSTGGVHLVPAFTGLGSPYWDADARAAILGITRGTTRAHIARAALEAIALQSAELLLAMQSDAGVKLAELKVDGGAAANNLLMQLQADLLGVPVVRPAVLESTALGAADLAALGAGLFASPAEIAAARRESAPPTVFAPVAARDWAEEQLDDWRRAVARVLTEAPGATPAQV